MLTFSVFYFVFFIYSFLFHFYLTIQKFYLLLPNHLKSLSLNLLAKCFIAEWKLQLDLTCIITEISRGAECIRLHLLWALSLTLPIKIAMIIYFLEVYSSIICKLFITQVTHVGTFPWLEFLSRQWNHLLISELSRFYMKIFLNFI